MPRLPNVILVTTDQHRADALGCAGNEALATPVLDRLAASGVRYTNAVAQAPVCTPARASWITGQYLATHGVWANGVPLPDGPDLLPRLFRQAGYSTAMVGKLHVAPSMSSRQPQDGDYGFGLVRLTEGRDPGGYQDWLMRTAREQAGKFHHGFPPEREGDVYGPGECLPEDLHPTRWVTERAISAWHQRVQHRPHFMHVSFPDPHHPFEAPARFVDMVRRERLAPRVPAPENWSELPPHFRMHREGRNPLFRGRQNLAGISDETWEQIRVNYYAMIMFIDREIGRLLDVVEAGGEPCLVVFTADHGELLGDHGLLYKGLFHYDGLIKVPLIVSGAGVREPGTVIDSPVQQIDIMPTLLDTCGLTVPASCQGTGLPGVTRPVDDAPYEYTLTEQRAPWHDPELRCVTLRSNRWKLTVFNRGELGELYDLANDPSEQTNLWSDPAHADTRARLLHDLAQRRLETEAPGHRRTFRA